MAIVIVERADAFGMTDDAGVSARCRNAPADIKRRIDDDREQRGQRRLWTRAGLSSSRTLAESRGTPIADHVLCVGVAAPGVSDVRVRVATDGELLRERIDPTAYRQFLRSVAAGETVVRFTDGHGGDTLADTKTGTLRLSVHDTAGLVVRALVPVCSLHRQLLADALSGEAGLSLGLRPARIQLGQRKGERIRIVRETGVDHVALVRSLVGHGRAAYRGRVFAALVSKADDHKPLVDRAVKAALEDIRRQGR